MKKRDVHAEVAASGDLLGQRKAEAYLNTSFSPKDIVANGSPAILGAEYDLARSTVSTTAPNLEIDLLN